MRLTKETLKRIIKEELEVVLTNEEAGEIFGEEVQAQLEADEAASDPIVNPAGAEAAEADEEGAEALAALALREEEEGEPEDEMTRRIDQLIASGDIPEKYHQKLMDMKKEIQADLRSAKPHTSR
jgi:phosphoribosylaminoimidazole-succinocarboxamide synthase